MFRYRGSRWPSSFGGPTGFGDGMGYGWPDQIGRQWYRRGSPFGGFVSAGFALALIALAISWWNGRRQPFTS
jgi:hypothetical protein